MLPISDRVLDAPPPYSLLFITTDLVSNRVQDAPPSPYPLLFFTTDLVSEGVLNAPPFPFIPPYY